MPYRSPNAKTIGAKPPAAIGAAQNAPQSRLDSAAPQSRLGSAASGSKYAKGEYVDGVFVKADGPVDPKIKDAIQRIMRVRRASMSACARVVSTSRVFKAVTKDT